MIYPIIHIIGLTDVYPEFSGVGFEPYEMKVDCSIFLKDISANTHKAFLCKYNTKRVIGKLTLVCSKALLCRLLAFDLERILSDAV